MDTSDNMTDEEFLRWMNEQENAQADSEEIEVGPTTEEPEVDSDVDDGEDGEVEEVDELDNAEDGDDTGEEDLEQPDGDSDDNSDEEKPDEEDSDDSEADETDADEQPEEKTETAKTETQPVEPVTYKYKANGEEFEFTEQEIKEQFGAVFAKAMDYTKKTQALKKYRQMIDAMEQEKLTPEDMNFAIDLLRGDKEAIASLVKKSGVDALELELDAESKYTPKNYGRTDIELDIQEITAEISKDPEYEVTHKVLTKDWDDDSWSEMTKKPQLIKLLHTDVKSGVFGKVNPTAQKLKMQDELRYGRSMRSDLDYYKQAAQVIRDTEYQNQLVRERQAEVETQTRKIADVKQASAKREETKQVATKRKAAAPTKSNAGTKKSVDYLEEALNMSDDDYVKWMEKRLK